MRVRNARSEESPGRPVQRRTAGPAGRKTSGPAPTRPSPCPPGPAADWTPAAVLGLQRSAGNAVVARLLSEEQTTSGADNGHGLRVSGPPSRFEREAGSPIQRFTVYKPGDEKYPALREKKRFGSKPAQETEKFFPSQDKDFEGKFTDASGKKANIKYHDMPDLNISDNFDLAVENNVEAKYFYATKDHVKRANKKLKGSVSFKSSSKMLVITLEGGKKIELFQVLPIVKEGGIARKGLDVTMAQQCNAMAEQVTGQKGVARKLEGDEYIARILDETEKDGKWLISLREKFKDASMKQLLQEEYFHYKDAMISEFLDRGRDHPEAIEDAIARLHLNQHIEPPFVGDAMATQSVATQGQLAAKKGSGEDYFEYHFGGVVAVSGNDYVTMENYAREQGMAVSSGDPLYFFKMYGAERTWHDAQQATGSFFGAVLSMVVKGA